MSRREDIDNDIWSDPDFEAISPAGKLVYIWTFTNPRCGMAGIYKLAKSFVTLETGLSETEVDDALRELADADFAYYERGVLWVRTRVKHLRTRTPQIARSVAKDVEKLAGDHPLRVQFLEMYGAYGWLAEQLSILAPDEYGWGVPVTVSPKLRREVFERDGHKCVKCDATRALTIDHRKPRSHGGDNSLENLQTLCLSCNSRKGPRSDLAPQAVSSDVLQEVPTRTSNKRFKGNGKGRGKGQGDGLVDTRARMDAARAWATEHLPDLPADFVATAYLSTQGTRSPERVRARVLASYPSLREDAA